MKWWWPSHPQAQTYTRDSTGHSPGGCEVCSGYGMICLNGRRFLCWDHYCAEMQSQRQAAVSQGAANEA